MRALGGRDGFTLLESLIALAILTVMLVPMLGAVNQSQSNSRIGLELSVIALDAEARMEAVLAKSFSSMTTGTTNYTVTTGYGSYPGTVAIATFDCSGDGTPDAVCKQIQVSAGGVRLTALKASY